MDDKRFTVLLVEDDLNDIFLVKRAFKMAHLHDPLQVVTDGQEAINYLKGEEKYADRQAYPLPKLIVMDIKMPRRTGFEVLEWVKGNGGPLRRIPIVIVSSSDNPADINRAYELGGECVHGEADGLSRGRAFIQCHHAILGIGVREAGT